MYKCTISFFLFILLFFVNCKRQNDHTIAAPDMENQKTHKAAEFNDQIPDDIKSLPLRSYYGVTDVLAPDGKIIRVYNNEIKETQWGPIYSPIVYLYNKDNEVLAKFNTLELISQDFWPGDIDISYNNVRNSFDFIFSLDARGNYGTGYIDLNTNEYIRGLKSIEPSEEEKLLQQLQNQNVLEEREEGSTLRKRDTIIFSLDPNNTN